MEYCFLVSFRFKKYSMRHTETWDKPPYFCWRIQINLHHKVVTAHVRLCFYTTPNSQQVKHKVGSSFGLTGIGSLEGALGILLYLWHSWVLSSAPQGPRVN